MRVAVIGCGPAGLAAAHAAVGQGAEDVVVFAPKVKTPQLGPLLIQRPIPGINTSHPDGTIHQRVIGGSILDYRYKLYGDINIGINGDILRPEYHAWRHGETYDKLWDLHKHLIVNSYVTAHHLRRMHESWDLVVSTANTYKLCHEGGHSHSFQYAIVYVTSVAEYPGQPDNTIVFNAGKEFSWVRSSRIFGQEVTEWTDPPVGRDGWRLIQKPISTDCTCFPHVLRTGRFGAWRNETWVDTAYWDTWTAIESMRRAHELEGIK